MYQVVFYEKENGEVPVRDYLSELSVKLRAKTLRSVALLERYGPELGEPESKRVGENLYELRSTFASDTGRVMYFFMAGKTAVLTNGFLKKSRRLPGRERERAERYRLDYMRRFGND